MNKPASRVEAILQRMLGADTNIEKPASRVEFLLSNVKDLLLAVEDEVEKLEGKTTRLLYSDKINPTAQEIDAFAIEKGYESPYEGVAVVVSGTYHIWHFYENDNISWRDDGVDTITPFTNLVPGSILGSADDGKIGANQDGTGSVNGWDNIPVIKDSGRSSTKTKTVNDPADVDSHGNPIDRTNAVDGDFASALGSRNTVTSSSTESLTAGGKNTNESEDSLLFGYECQNGPQASQSLTGGYDVHNNATESVAVGNGIRLGGGSTSSTKTKYCSLLGSDLYVGNGSRNSYLFGHNIYQGVDNGVKYGPEKLKNALIAGTDILLGDEVNWVNAFGDTLTIAHKVQDSVIMGYNHIAANTGSDALHYIYMFGRDHTNVGSDSTEHQNFYAMGCGLRPSEDDQILLGNYNDDVDHCWLNVGCGSKNKQTGVITRKTAFAVCQQGNNYWIEVGGQKLYKSDIADNATKTWVNSVVGDINNILDAINGEVV